MFYNAWVLCGTNSMNRKPQRKVTKLKSKFSLIPGLASSGFEQPSPGRLMLIDCRDETKQIVFGYQFWSLSLSWTVIVKIKNNNPTLSKNDVPPLLTPPFSWQTDWKSVISTLFNRIKLIPNITKSPFICLYTLIDCHSQVILLSRMAYRQAKRRGKWRRYVTINS